MKKFILPALFAVALGFTSCGSDDNEDGASNCKECDLFGIAQVKICDKGEGKAEITSTVAGFGSETQTVDLPENTTFDAYAEGVCSGTIELE